MTDLRNLLTVAQFEQLTPESINKDPEIRAMGIALAPQIQSAAVAIARATVLPRTQETVNPLSSATLDSVARNFNLHTLSFWGRLTVVGKRAALRGAIAHQRRSGTVGAVKRIFAVLEIDGSVIEWFQEGAAAHTYRITADSAGSPYSGSTGDIEVWIREWCYRFGRASQHLTSVTVL